MTQNSGDSGLCFEIWYRKRKTQDTYTLQAASREVKDAWTKDLGHILWEQAVHNRGAEKHTTSVQSFFAFMSLSNASMSFIEMYFKRCFLTMSVSEIRMQERVFMGIGNKPFMDIQPSEAAINDRAINYVLMGRGTQILTVTQFTYYI